MGRLFGTSRPNTLACGHGSQSRSFLIWRHYRASKYYTFKELSCIQQRARDTTMKPHLHSYVWPHASNHTFIVTLWRLLYAGIAYTARRVRAGQSHEQHTQETVPVRTLRKVRVLIVPYIHASAVALSCAGIGALLLRCRELLHVSCQHSC